MHVVLGIRSSGYGKYEVQEQATKILTKSGPSKVILVGHH